MAKAIDKLSDVVLPSKAKKKPLKMDKLLVAAKESHEGEVKYIASRYKVPIGKVREAMKAVGKNGKPSRSRAKIYAQLRTMGYPMVTRTTK